MVAFGQSNVTFAATVVFISLFYTLLGRPFWMAPNMLPKLCWLQICFLSFIVLAALTPFLLAFVLEGLLRVFACSYIFALVAATVVNERNVYCDPFLRT